MPKKKKKGFSQKYTISGILKKQRNYSGSKIRSWGVDFWENVIEKEAFNLYVECFFLNNFKFSYYLERKKKKERKKPFQEVKQLIQSYKELHL